MCVPTCVVMHIHMCVYACACGCPQGPEDSIGFPGAVVTGGCALHDADLGNQTLGPVKEQHCVLNC